MSTLSGIMSTVVTWLCCASKVAIDRPTYPVPATAMFIDLVTFLVFFFVPSVNTSIGSKPRTSPNCSNCGMDGRKSSFSMREISERLMPVASARDCCVMESFFRLDVIRSARRAVESVFMVRSFLLFGYMNALIYVAKMFLKITKTNKTKIIVAHFYSI